jgi:hypothetical protein
MPTPLPSHVFGASPEFGRFRHVLADWLEYQADERDLYEAGVGVSRAIHTLAVSPEHLLLVLHAAGLHRRDALNAGVVAARDERYAAAVHLLMQQCYRNDSMPRVVRDVDGRDWTVMTIREGERWDPEIEMRRRDWLCCVTIDDRRYISPVPPDWEQWSAMDLAAAIRKAKPDLRGPR